MSDRPVPEPDEVSAPYWEAAARGELRIARCSRCEHFTMPPDTVCPHCRSAAPAFRFEAVSGRGVVRSWTVVRQSFLPGFDPPFTLLDVELDGTVGVRLIGRQVGDPSAELRLGAPVEVAFEDVAPGVAVPAFALVAGP